MSAIENNLNNTPETENTITPETAKTPQTKQIPATKKANTTSTIKPIKNTKKFNFLNESRKLSGSYFIGLNPAKLSALLKSANIEVSPETSFGLLGEYVNRYGNDYTVNSDKSKITAIQLNNNYVSTLEIIKKFAGEGSSDIISPKSFINCINSFSMYYKEGNKKTILLHLAYLAEVIYQHMSILFTNEKMERDAFFERTDGLDYLTLIECAEFFYTDIYLLSSTEKKELIDTLNNYYLKPIADITQKIENTKQKMKKEEEIVAKEMIELEKEEAAMKAKKEVEKAKAEAAKKIENAKLTELARASLAKEAAAASRRR